MLGPSRSHASSSWEEGKQEAKELETSAVHLCPTPYRDYVVSHFKRRRRQWHPTPVLLPGKSHGQRSLVGCSPRLFATPWIVAHQAAPSIGFSRQEYWSGLPFPSPAPSIGASASASVFFNEYSRLIFFRVDCLDLLAVQRTLKSLLQHHSSKA